MEMSSLYHGCVDRSPVEMHPCKFDVYFPRRCWIAGRPTSTEFFDRSALAAAFIWESLDFLQVIYMMRADLNW
jgi:hypothetical protein